MSFKGLCLRQSEKKQQHWFPLIIYFLEEIETCCCFREATPFEVMGKGSEHNDLIAYGPHREPAVSSAAESPQLID